MIDVSQWRASIGLWNYCQAASSRPANGYHSYSFKGAVDSKSGSTTSGEKSSKLPAALSLIAFLLLLFHSLSLLRHILMIPSTGNCYLVQCTTVNDMNYLQSVVLPGGSSSNLIHNDLYLIVCLRMLLLISGDVELNPGPVIDDRPDIPLLTQWLEPLVDWKPFGRSLPGMTYSDISKIEAENVKIDERKSALYSKWLSIAPTATWADVINALNKRRENKLVQDIRRNLQKSAPRSARSCVAVTTRPSPQMKTVMFDTAEDEKGTLRTLIDLNKEFSILMMHTRLGIEEKTKKDSDCILHRLIIWLETYMHWNDMLTNASLDETFKIIHPFYDFIDCSLIVDMSEVFLQDFEFGDELNIVSELKKHQERADQLRFSAQVKHLNDSLKTIYEEHLPDISSMPTIFIKLHNPWHSSNINGLSLLIHNLLPFGYQQSIMKYIKISFGSVIIEYSLYGSTADSLIEYTGGKLQFIRLIGIFSLYINDHPVLQEDENMNFTFELALLDAVTVGNNEAVEFLLQLETVNIDHTNEKGKTALMLACEGGHEDIVHNLLSAGADVNIQDNNGLTALMIASEHNHISIIRMLLQANANPNLKVFDGSNALMIASYHGNYEVVELLISKGVDYKYQREDGCNTFMLACKNGHTQIVELLLKEQVDPNVQMNDGVNAFMAACKNGHTQIVELLLKEQIDSNVQANNGVNAFMLACQNGHTQIVELLLKERVDPNIQTNDGVNAFMSVCKNGHTQIVELLLKEQVDPNVQTNDGVNAFMLACKNGHTQIVELLLKERVDYNVQKKDGVNAFMLACKNGHTQIVKLLLEEQVDPNVQSRKGHTALMIASTKGHYEVVKLLLEWKVDPNIKSNEGYTALFYAKTDEISALINNYLKGVIKFKEDVAASVDLYSFPSQRTVSSGYHTVSNISIVKSYPSTDTLGKGDFTDKK
uniref:Death domain-containing protein n=2 Tax=Amphimedon queenslandica TaxID=400682 RepID=A0A1X7UW08_AMPQE